ncbi:MAG: hypothetical protein ABH824_05650 [Nanoarchaeota archaeon]
MLLFKQKPWSKLTKKEKKLRKTLITVGIVLLVISFIAGFVLVLISYIL